MAAPNVDFSGIEVEPQPSIASRSSHYSQNERGFAICVVVIFSSFALTCAWVLYQSPPSASPVAVTPPPQAPQIVERQQPKTTSRSAWLASPKIAPMLRESGPDKFHQQSGNDPDRTEAAAVVNRRIDRIMSNQLVKLDIEPAYRCSDAVFQRRVYIDVLGTIPTASEAVRFLDDTAPQKRERLIDELLQRPEFADCLAMKWCDILRVKAEFPIKLWPNAAHAYHRWIRTAIDRNMPYDEFVRNLLTTSGSNFRKPQVNFYRAVESHEPHALAQAVALSFMCERADAWPAERLEDMSAFFSRVGYKPTGEWKEEIVFFDRRKGDVSARGGLKATFPDETTVVIPPDRDPRTVFADWLLDRQNPVLARALVNRVCYWLLGRGIVEPVDDVRSDNPASNPRLMEYLARELVSSGYDVKELYRTILNSQAYQLSSLPRSENPLAAVNFAYYPVRRLDAEVLIDAICQVTGVPESYSSIIPEPFTFLPDGQRAISLPDGSITSSFLELFGRPSRDTGLESDRNNRLTAAQALHLLNSNHLRNKLRRSPALKQLLNEAWSSMSSSPSDSIYLAILSRRPTNEEKVAVSRLCLSAEGVQEVAWALINSDEFLFRH